MEYFKGKQFKKDIILVAIGYYCRFSLSYRDVSELLRERMFCASKKCKEMQRKVQRLAATFLNFDFGISRR